MLTQAFELPFVELTHSPYKSGTISVALVPESEFVEGFHQNFVSVLCGIWVSHRLKVDNIVDKSGPVASKRRASYGKNWDPFSGCPVVDAFVADYGSKLLCFKFDHCHVANCMPDHWCVLEL